MIQDIPSVLQKYQCLKWLNSNSQTDWLRYHDSYKLLLRANSLRYLEEFRDCSLTPISGTLQIVALTHTNAQTTAPPPPPPPPHHSRKQGKKKK